VQLLSHRPSAPFVEISIIEARQASEISAHDESKVIGKLREEAGRQGCDALVLTGSADQVVGSGSGYTDQGTGFSSSSIKTLKGYRGVCIVFTATPGPPVAAKPRTRPPPEGAAGYRYDEPPEAAQAACISGGFEWTADGDGFRCSGLRADLGLSGHSRHTFCGGSACVIEVVAPVAETDEPALDRAWLDIRAKLEARYGRPRKDTSFRASDCAAGQLAECLQTRRAAYVVHWIWEQGPRMTLTLDAGSSQVALRVVYESAKRAAQDSVSGL
jgi:hypothetical protein